MDAACYFETLVTARRLYDIMIRWILERSEWRQAACQSWTADANSCHTR